MSRLAPERFENDLASPHFLRIASLLAALACAAPACGGGTPDARDPGSEAPLPEPSWEGVEIGGRFASRSFGEVSQLARGRFGAKKDEGLVIAGRSLLATGAGGETLWRAEWDPDEEDGAFMGGLAVGLRIVDANGDGADDLLAVNDYGEVHLFDGADGSSRWSVRTEQTAGVAQTVIFGDDAAPLVLPAHTIAALDVATGERRWTLPVQAPPVLATPARAAATASVLFAGIDRGSIGATDPDLVAIGSDGKVIFSASTGDWVLSLGAADLDGEGHETLLAGSTSGTLIALEPDGTERFREAHLLGGKSLPEFTYVERIAAQDLDGDGPEEILFSLRDYYRPELTQLVAVDESGAERWRLPLGNEASILLPWSGAERPMLFAALGPQAFGAPGLVAAIETGADGPRVLWTQTFPWFVTALEVAPDGSAVLAGTMDGRVRAFGLADGAPMDGPSLGNFSTPAIAVAGDRVFVGDSAGVYSLLGADGARLWNRTIELDGMGVALAAVAMGEAEDPTLLAIGVSPFSGGDPGTIQAFTQGGDTRYVVRTSLAPGVAAAARAADGERLIVTYSGELLSSDCRVMAHAPTDGAVIWDRALLPCIWTSVAAADVDGDGRDEIVVSGFSYDYPPFVALLEADGSLRWIRKTEEIPMWVAAGPGLVAVGGAMGTEGFAAALDPRTGEARWTTALPSLPDPEDPRKRLPGHSSFGAIAPAPGGKRSSGIAASTDCGQVFWLAAEDGAVAWSRTPQTERVPASPRYGGGPIAIAPATSTEPTAILATQVTPYLVRTVAIAYGLDGEEKGAFELEGSVRGVSVGAAASGRRTIGAATTLGTAAFEIRRP